jgi:IS30 family transposase
LIRQYYPKGKIYDKITESDIRKIEKELNNRPRKRLNYLTPYEVFVLGLDPEKDSRVQRLI